MPVTELPAMPTEAVAIVQGDGIVGWPVNGLGLDLRDVAEACPIPDAVVVWADWGRRSNTAPLEFRRHLIVEVRAGKFPRVFRMATVMYEPGERYPLGNCPASADYRRVVSRAKRRARKRKRPMLAFVREREQSRTGAAYLPESPRSGGLCVCGLVVCSGRRQFYGYAASDRVGDFIPIIGGPAKDEPVYLHTVPPQPNGSVLPDTEYVNPGAAVYQCLDMCCHDRRLSPPWHKKKGST